MYYLLNNTFLCYKIISPFVFLYLFIFTNIIIFSIVISSFYIVWSDKQSVIFSSVSLICFSHLNHSPS